MSSIPIQAHVTVDFGLFVGRLSREKGIASLLATWRQITQTTEMCSKGARAEYEKALLDWVELFRCSVVFIPMRWPPDTVAAVRCDRTS